MIDANLLLQGYAKGIFPMATSRNGEIQWYSANPRGYIDLHDFIVPKRILRYIRNLNYDIRINSEFEQVMRACADRPRNEDTWISEEMIGSYINLYHLGHAHSVEVFIDEKLVGGLYGVSLQAAFFGESMFNRVPNASKIALFHLIQRLLKREFRLLDIQMITPTTAWFGAKTISQGDYEKKLKFALEIERKFI